MPITHYGSVSSLISLPDTYCIPQLTLNLISVGQLVDQGLNVFFSSSGVQVQDPHMGQTLGMGRKVGRLFELQSLRVSSLPTHHVSATCPTSSLQ